jgi:hypothetical protein
MFLFTCLEKYFFVTFRLTFDEEKFLDWLRNIKWTSQLKTKWQEFYNKGSRRIIQGGGNHIDTSSEYVIPQYQDLKQEQCQRFSNSANSQQKIFVILLFISFLNRSA